MEAIQFNVYEFKVKIPFLDSDTIKGIAPILSAIYKAYTNDTPQAVLVKDFDFIAQDELMKKDPLVKQSIERGLRKFYEICLVKCIIEKDNAQLDNLAKNELLRDDEIQNEIYGNALFFFALVRYLGKRVLNQLETPLIVPYSTTPHP